MCPIDERSPIGDRPRRANSCERALAGSEDARKRPRIDDGGCGAGHGAALATARCKAVQRLVTGRTSTLRIVTLWSQNARQPSGPGRNAVTIMRLSRPGLTQPRTILRLAIWRSEARPSHTTPSDGYSIRRANAAGRTGSAKVSATASHSSGLGTLRRRMSSFFSSARRVWLS